MARVSPEPNSGCWLWTGMVNHNGYGLVSYQSRTMRAHRVSYEWHVGPIPSGLHIDHLCKVRVCVNPAHLEAVTQAVNNQRSPPTLPECGRRCTTHGCQQPALHRKAGSAMCPKCRVIVRRPPVTINDLCARCREVFAPREAKESKP